MLFFGGDKRQLEIHLCSQAISAMMDSNCFLSKHVDVLMTIKFIFNYLQVFLMVDQLTICL